MIPYKGGDSWGEKIIFNIHKWFNGNKIISSGHDFNYCDYIVNKH